MKRKLITVLGLVAAAIFAGAGTSQAADVVVYTTTGGGRAGWTENGDTLTVCDISSDGYGVRGYVYTPYSDAPQNGTVLIKGNDPSNDGNCAAFPGDLSESIHISLKVCEYAGDVVTYCDYVKIR
ncbi:MAG: hypothetical protein HOV73_08140 [Streptomyces sp.]|nr:hypothetical protein [Streptomyces sp.]NUP17190.1 hypothetical protein [Streptomyces sp.]NUR40037.1 hypothetical protein [Streptomyces sp.]NUS30830.1 hypothetical protein [Streptomyces sp.]NUS74580.1 hypothetical protein [Streptomyces sp.]